MKKQLLAFFSSYDAEAEQQDEQANLLDTVNKARDEWHAAQNYFENVSEPELVDYAIYKVEETRRKYMYLLKQAKREGLVQEQVL